MADVTADAVVSPEEELTPQQVAKLDRIIEEFKGHKGAVIPILQETQDLLGYLPKKVLKYISQKTLIPLTQLHGVATFYAQFRLQRRGKHLIRICDGTACHVRGADKNIQAIRHSHNLEPGATSKDYRFSLEIVYCLGSCGLAPVALVDERVCGRLVPDHLVKRLNELS